MKRRGLQGSRTLDRVHPPQAILCKGRCRQSVRSRGIEAVGGVEQWKCRAGHWCVLYSWLVRDAGWLLTTRSSGDVADSSISQQACATALEKFGRLDGVILNAGTLDPLGTCPPPLLLLKYRPDHRHSRPSGPVTKTDIKDWQTAFNVNFFSLVTMLQATAPALRQSKGKIVFVSSGAATGDTQGWAAYNSTKVCARLYCVSPWR